MINIEPCPVCHSEKVIVFEVGEAERDTLTKETWFTGNTEFYCRCMNEDCIHDGPFAPTYERAVELWNNGTIYKWEEKWVKIHNKREDISDFY